VYCATARRILRAAVNTFRRRHFMSVVSDLRRGRVNLDDPAVTTALLQADAVLGVRGVVKDGELQSIGIIEHYDRNGIGAGGTPLGLTDDEKAALVEYLKSL
jgi:hypothetical protein